MEIKETYNSLQQEVDVKTKKLKKVSPTLLGDSAGWGSAGKDASFLWTVFVRAGGVRMLGSVVQLMLLLRVCGVLVVEDKFRSPYLGEAASVPRAALSIPTEVHPHRQFPHADEHDAAALCVCVRKRESV